MRKFLFTIIALMLMSSAMAQDSKPKGKNDALGFGGGISYQFIKGGGAIDLDVAFVDAFVGWYGQDDVSSISAAFSLVQPFSFYIGEYFFVRPTVGFGYYYSKSTIRILGKTDEYKTNAFDFLLFPKVGFKFGKFTIFATYRYDAPNFKFEGKGTWGVGIGFGN